MQISERGFKSLSIQDCMFILSIIFYIGYLVMSYRYAQWEPIPSENVYKQSIAVTPISRVFKIIGLFLLFLTFLLSVAKQGIKCSQRNVFFIIIYVCNQYLLVR